MPVNEWDAAASIAVAKRIAEDNDFGQVVIWASRDDGSQHVVTFGTTLENKARSADAGGRVKKAAGWPDELTHATPGPLEEELVRLRRRVAELEGKAPLGEAARRPPPMQPFVRGERGEIRFQENHFVRLLLDQSEKRGYGLNQLIPRGGIEGAAEEDLAQFYQLIGYSISGYHEMSFFSDETCRAATEAARAAFPEVDAGGCRDQGCAIHTRGGT